MITRDNIQEVLNNLTIEEITTEIDKDGDFVEIWVHTSNSGFYTSIESGHYDEETEQNANDNGQLFIDKDDFLNMLGDNNHEYSN